MKKRFLCGFLAVVMCLSLLPAAAWADEGDGTPAAVPSGESGSDDSGSSGGDPGGSGGGNSGGSGGASDEQLVSVINISGGGGPDFSNINVSATYESLTEYGDDGDIISGRTARYMGGGYRLASGADEYTPFYFADTGEETTHEIILYSATEMDPTMLHITSGATLTEGFTIGTCGDGSGALYYYKGTITIPADGGYISIFYRQNSVVRLDARRISGFDGATTILFTNIYPKSYTEADGDISSFTVEVAGMDLPTAKESYSIEGFSTDSVSGPDGTGKLTLSFTKTVSAARSSWLTILVNGQARMSFESPSHVIETSAGGKYTYTVNTTYAAFGSPVEITSPYYILEGGTPVDPSAPAVSVQDATTTGDTATVAVTNSGYTDMRWAMTEDGLSAASWLGSVPASVTVSTPAVGSYTVYFQFRDSGGAVVSRSATVTRQSSVVLAAPIGLGIAETATGKIPARDGSGAYQLYSSTAYTVYAQMADGQRDPARGITVSWGSGGSRLLSWSEANQRYEARNLTLSGSALTFRAQQLATDAGAHESASLSIDMTNVPGIYYSYAPWVDSSYSEGYYWVDPGKSTINAYFTGGSGSGVAGYAELFYATAADGNATQTVGPLACSDGTYSGTVTVPSDATALSKIEYYLAMTDGEGNDHYSARRSHDLTRYKISPVLTFTGFDSSYYGADIEITRTGGFSRRETISGAGTAVFNGVDLDDGSTYTYAITGEGGLIKKGALDKSWAANGTIAASSLSLPTLHTLSISGITSNYVYLRFVRNFGADDEEILSFRDNRIKQIPAGATGRIGAYVYYDHIRGISAPDGADLNDITVGGDLSYTLQVDNYNAVTAEATVTGVATKPVASNARVYGASLELRQSGSTAPWMNGVINSRSLSSWSYAYSGSDGSYTLNRMYADLPATVTVSRAGFKTQTVEIAASGSQTQNISLEFQDELVVTPRLYAMQLKSSWTNSFGYQGLVNADTSLLNLVYLRRVNSDGTEVPLSFTAESVGSGDTRYFISSWYKEASLTGGPLQKGDRIRAYFSKKLTAGAGIVLTEKTAGNANGGTPATSAWEKDWLYYYEGTLDDKLNVAFDVYGEYLGGFSDVVVSSGGTSDMGMLLVFQNWGQYGSYGMLAAQAAGQNELYISGLEPGDYTVIALRYEQRAAEAAANLLQNPYRLYQYVGTDIPADGSAKELTGVRAYKATAENGVIKRIDQYTVTYAADSTLLGDYLIRYTTSQAGTDGTVEVNAWLEPIAAEPRPIQQITVYRESGAGSVSVNGRTLNDSAISLSSFNNQASLYLSRSDDVTSARIYYRDKPSGDASTVVSQIQITYYNNNGSYGGELTASVSTSIQRFELDAPQKQLLASAAKADGSFDADHSDPWVLPVTVIASPMKEQNGLDPQEITIYDNGVPVATRRLSGNSETFDINLIRPGTYGLHEIYATRPNAEAGGDAVLVTEKFYVNVADPDKEIGASHLIWWHHNDRGLQQWEFERLNDIGSKTIRYWPARKSAVAFVIANATADELDNVRLACSYLGVNEYNRVYATPITQAQFLSYWNAMAGKNGVKTLSASDFPAATDTTNNPKGITYSFWMADMQGNLAHDAKTNKNIDMSAVRSNYPRPDSAASGSAMDVDRFGVSFGYFKGFTVKYDYVGPAVKLTQAALLPVTAGAYDKTGGLSDSDFKLALSIIDGTADALDTQSLKNYYRTLDAEGEFSKFGTRTDIIRQYSGTDAEKATMQETFSSFLSSEADSLPAVMRDAAQTPGDVTVKSSAQLTAAEKTAATADLRAGETVMDISSVEVKNADGTTMTTTTSLSTVNITSEEAEGSGNWLNTTDQTRASYVEPDSEEAVRWLMNYEREKKYGRVYQEWNAASSQFVTKTIDPDTDPKWQNISWTHYETEQGTVYERYETTTTGNDTDGYTTTVKTTTYLPNQAVADLIGQENASVAYQAATASLSSAGKFRLMANAGDPFSEEKVKEGMTRLENLNTAYSAFSIGEDLRQAYNVSQIMKGGTTTMAFANEIAAGQRLTGSGMGTAMGVIGLGVATYQVSQGPQGKDEGVLFEALNKMDDPYARWELQNDILDYADRKSQLYLGESITGVTNAGAACTGNPIVGAVSFLASGYATYKGSVAHADLNAEYDALVSRINNQLSMEGIQRQRDFNADYQSALSSLQDRLVAEGFEGARLQEELNRFNYVKGASGEYGFVPVNGWGQAVGQDPTQLYGYVPEQPAPGKFDVDWGPSFGGTIPTEAQLAAFYGQTTTEAAQIAMENDTTLKTNSTSLEALINKVETDLQFNLEFKNCWEMEQEVAGFSLYIDPSGYVFEAVEDARVSGIEATIYEGTPGGTFTAWTDTNPDESERQATTQTTSERLNVTTGDVNPATGANYTEAEILDTKGRYGWMTPEGIWKVGFHDTAGNYQDAETKPMTVPPEHTTVNIGLISTAAPTVAKVEKNANGTLTFTFDKWMQLESIASVSGVPKADDGTYRTKDGATYTPIGFDSDKSVITVTDASGNVLPGKITFPDQRVNTGYKATREVLDESGNAVTEPVPYQTDYIGSDVFVKTAVFTPDAAFASGTQQDLTVSRTALSYAGVAMVQDYTVNTADLSTPDPDPDPDPEPAPTPSSGGSSGSSSAAAPAAVSAASGSAVSAGVISRLISAGGSLTVTGSGGASAVFSADALKGIGSGSAVTVTLADASGSYAAAYPGKEVYTLDVTAGGSAVTGFGGDVAVTLPHVLGAEETNPRRVTVYQLDKEGEAAEKLDTVYDTKAEAVTFTTGEAGAFLIDYIPFPYGDVRTDTWYYDAVDWADLEGVTTGKSADAFDPQGSASRAEVVTFLWRCAGSPVPRGESGGFSDVADGAWYSAPVLWAAEQDITKGTGNGNFSPAATVTREQFVTLLYRMAGSAPAQGNPFSDVDAGDYFYEAVLWATANGVTSGTGGGLFSPERSCDRSQVVTMLYRWFGR